MRSIAEIVAAALEDVAKNAQRPAKPLVPSERLTHVPGSDPRFRVIPPPAPETRAKGYYYIFCSHHKPYWSTCTKCGRDKELARRNADIVLRSVGGAAFFTK